LERKSLTRSFEYDPDGPRIALFIGRFQPFHKGHVYMIKTILEDFNEVIIGVGSAQYSNTRDNPFNVNERIEMIERALKSERIGSCQIVPIEDIHDDTRWVEHVESLVPKFHAVFTHEKLTKRLFQEKGYEVIEARLFDREQYSGTEVRRRMLKGEDWRPLVPKDVAKYIKEIKGEQRVREAMLEYSSSKTDKHHHEHG
jgi:nicotinamide-nucleotide adenylyltransferase